MGAPFGIHHEYDAVGAKARHSSTSTPLYWPLLPGAIRTVLMAAFDTVEKLITTGVSVTVV
jgi:hypothetical protein